MVFPVVMYGCESWTVRKVERWRIDAFELWCWRRLLRVPWTARRSNQSILKKINPEYSLEGLKLKLKLQYFGHLIWGTNSLEKSENEGRRRRGWQRMRWLDVINDSMDMSLSKLWEMVTDRKAWCSPWGHKELDTTKKQQQQMPKQLFGHVWLLLLHFLTSLIKLIIWVKIFYRQKSGGGHEAGVYPG